MEKGGQMDRQLPILCYVIHVIKIAHNKEKEIKEQEKEKTWDMIASFQTLKKSPSRLALCNLSICIIVVK
jgi:hypothetical protein